VILPVVWGSSSSLCLLGYDVVFHIGLGVYKFKDRMVLEDGASNV